MCVSRQGRSCRPVTKTQRMPTNCCTMNTIPSPSVEPATNPSIGTPFKYRRPVVFRGFIISCNYRGKVQEKCPLCGASYMPEYKGTVCKICLVSSHAYRWSGVTLHNSLMIHAIQVFYLIISCICTLTLWMPWGSAFISIN